MTQVFLDTNIPLYATGQPHPLKDSSAIVLALASEKPEGFITDVEVLQEVLHIFLRRKEWLRGQRIFRLFAELMTGRVEGIAVGDVEVAAMSATTYPTLNARDLIHLAVMQRLGLQYIISTDKGFDAVTSIERLDPSQIESWKEKVIG